LRLIHKTSSTTNSAIHFVSSLSYNGSMMEKEELAQLVKETCLGTGNRVTEALANRFLAGEEIDQRFLDFVITDLILCIKSYNLNDEDPQILENALNTVLMISDVVESPSW
jgi:hypothetical protein